MKLVVESADSGVESSDSSPDFLCVEGPLQMLLYIVLSLLLAPGVFTEK